MVVVDTVAADGLGSGIRAIAGDASDDAVLGRAVQIAASSGTLSGWVNNAAVFRDAALHTSSAREVVELIAENLALAVAGVGAAVRRFLADGTAGAIVNVSSHQAHARGPRRAALRDRQGRDRGAHARAGRRLRAARHPHQRGRARLDRHRALRREPRRRAGAAAPARPRRARRGGRRGRRAPAVAGGELRQRRRRAGRRRPRRAGRRSRGARGLERREQALEVVLVRPRADRGAHVAACPGGCGRRCPASREAVARGLRVGVLEGDERGVAARRDRAAVRPRAARRARRPAPGRRREHVGHVGAAQHVERGER